MEKAGGTVEILAEEVQNDALQPKVLLKRKNMKSATAKSDTSRTYRDWQLCQLDLQPIQGTQR